MKVAEAPGIAIELSSTEARLLLDSLSIIFEGGFRLGAGMTFDSAHVVTDNLRSALRRALVHGDNSS